MTEEEKDEIVERVSRNVYRIVLEIGWYLLELSEDDMGGVHRAPTYEELTRRD